MTAIQPPALSVHVQRQYAQAPEGVAVRVAGTLAGIRTCVVDHAPETRGTLPVGSVEFVREALRRQGARVPAPIDYPPSLDRFLHRRIERLTLKDAAMRAGVWVKPCAEKAFDPGTPGALLESGISPDAPVWASNTVDWLCEYRCYVCRGEGLWMHRYDPDGADDAPEPGLDTVRQMIALYAASGESPEGYGLDVGVLSTGETALVEINDGYGLGYYGPVETVRAKGWLALLAARYQQLLLV
jgi:hypothetical protein